MAGASAGRGMALAIGVGVMLAAGCESDNAPETGTSIGPGDEDVSVSDPVPEVTSDLSSEREQRIQSTEDEAATQSDPPSAEMDGELDSDVELTPGTPGCDPATPFSPASLYEATATSSGVDAWVLAYQRPPWQVDQEVKVIWKVDGSGDASFVAIDERGGELSPSWGPNSHVDSSFNRPGDEWGTAFALPDEGCWELRVSRDEGHASIWLEVEVE